MRIVGYSLAALAVLLIVWGYRYWEKKLREHDKLQAALKRGYVPVTGGFVIQTDPTNRAGE